MTLATAPLRRLPFDVRPFHLESVDSYGDRLLAANYCDATHRAELMRQMPTGRSTQEKDAAWMTVLTSVAKRPTLHLDPVTTRCGREARCSHFDRTLPMRFACTLCSHGQPIRQNPHFENIVCVRHRRWLGLWGTIDRQRTASEDAVRAQITLNRLRRTKRIDPLAYLVIVNILGQALHPELPIDEVEERVFATAVELSRALTMDSFARRFFNLATLAAEAHTTLDTLVVSALGKPCPAVTRSLWIYLRPTRLALRGAATLRTNFKKPWTHDYPLRPATAALLSAYEGPLEDESQYLALTGDTPETAVTHMASVSSVFSARDREFVRHFVCSEGHEFDYLLPRNLPNAVPPSHYVPACGRCSDRRVRPGESDLRTMAPEVANQFDELRNGGLTASDVAASSKNKYMWVCAYGHSHEATPFKKTTSRYNCAICTNREVQPGVNCLVTTHPGIAAMRATGWGPGLATGAPAGSNFLEDWRCSKEHVFTARTWELTTGKRSCNICGRQRKVAREDSLEATHPHIVEMWDTVKNGILTPDLVTHGERREVWWRCKKGHGFRARLDKVTKGQNCPYCVKRRLLRGENDLASVEPILTLEYHLYLNDKAAHEIFPSNHLRWWKCRANGHVHKQTAQHRRESLGCPLCAPGERILANGRDKIDQTGATLAAISVSGQAT